MLLGFRSVASNLEAWLSDPETGIAQLVSTAMHLARLAADAVHDCRSTPHADFFRILHLLQTFLHDTKTPAAAVTDATKCEILCKGEWPAAVGDAFAALERLQPADWSSEHCTDAAAQLLRVSACMLAAACPECSHLLRSQLDDDTSTVAAESPAVAAVRALWCYWSSQLLPHAIATASEEELGHLVVVCASAVLVVPRETVWLAQKMLKPAHALCFSLHILLMRICKLTGERRPWLPTGDAARETTAQLSASKLSAWEGWAM